jgi:zinc-finger of transposase IS204/IS1001/IS1096/IS1165
MTQNEDWAPGPGVEIVGAERVGDRWVISAVGPDSGVCPGCRQTSTRRHSRYVRHLQDLPAQSARVMVKLQVSRWHCLNGKCRRRTFADRLPALALPHSRRTLRTAELVHLFGHTNGGRPGERLMKRLGVSVSDDTILRHLKRQVALRRETPPVRVAGVTIGAGEKAIRTGPSSSTSSGGWLSTSSTIVRRPGQPNGSDSIPRSKSSAAIDAVSTRKARETARTGRGRSLTGSTYCRTCAKRSKLS